MISISTNHFAPATSVADAFRARLLGRVTDLSRGLPLSVRQDAFDLIVYVSFDVDGAITEYYGGDLRIQVNTLKGIEAIKALEPFGVTFERIEGRWFLK